MLLHKKVHVVFSNLHSKVLSYELKLAAAVAHAIEGRPKTAKAFELSRSLEKEKGETDFRLVGFIVSYYTREEDVAEHKPTDNPAYVFKQQVCAERVNEPIATVRRKEDTHGKQDGHRVV